MTGRDRGRHVVKLRRARRAGPRQRERLEDARRARRPNRSAVGARARAPHKNIEQLWQAHRRVAAHRERDRHAAELGVASIGQRLSGLRRVLEEVHLAVGHGKERLRLVVLLHARLLHLGRRHGTHEMAARVAAMRLVLHQHAHLLVDLQAEREVVARRRVRLRDAGQWLVREQRAAFKVAAGHLPRTLIGAAPRRHDSRGGGLPRADLIIANDDARANDDDAARDTRQRHVQRAVRRRARRARLHRVKDAREVVPGFELLALGFEAVEVQCALGHARQQARVRVVRRRVAHSVAPNAHVLVASRLQVRRGHGARVQRGVACVGRAAHDAHVAPKPVLVVAASPRQHLWHALGRRDHQSGERLGRADGVAARYVHKDRVAPRVKARRCLAGQRLDGGRVGEILALRNHQPQYGRVLRRERGRPVVEVATAHLHDPRTPGSLPFERERQLVGRRLARDPVARFVGLDGHGFVELFLLLRFFVFVLLVLAIVLVVVLWRALRLSLTRLLGGDGGPHARSARHLRARVVLEQVGRGRVDVRDAVALHHPPQPRIAQHVHQQHPRRPDAHAVGPVDDRVADRAERAQLLRHDAADRAHLELRLRDEAHRVQKVVRAQPRRQRVRQQARARGHEKDVWWRLRVVGDERRRVEGGRRARIARRRAVALGHVLRDAERDAYRHRLSGPRRRQVAEVVAGGLLPTALRLLGLVHDRCAHRVRAHPGGGQVRRLQGQNRLERHVERLARARVDRALQAEYVRERRGGPGRGGGVHHHRRLAHFAVAGTTGCGWLLVRHDRLLERADQPLRFQAVRGARGRAPRVVQGALRWARRTRRSGRSRRGSYDHLIGRHCATNERLRVARPYAIQEQSLRRAKKTSPFGSAPFQIVRFGKGC